MEKMLENGKNHHSTNDHEIKKSVKKEFDQNDANSEDNNNNNNNASNKTIAILTSKKFAGIKKGCRCGSEPTPIFQERHQPRPRSARVGRPITLIISQSRGLPALGFEKTKKRDLTKKSYVRLYVGVYNCDLYVFVQLRYFTKTRTAWRGERREVNKE